MTRNEVHSTFVKNIGPEYNQAFIFNFSFIGNREHKNYLLCQKEEIRHILNMGQKTNDVVSSSQWQEKKKKKGATMNKIKREFIIQNLIQTNHI